MEVAKNGLYIPEDLAKWHKWSQQRNLKKRITRIVDNLPVSIESLFGASRTPETPEPVMGYLHVNDEQPQGLFVLDSETSTSLSSVIMPLHYLKTMPVAVWATSDITDLLPSNDWQVKLITEEELKSLSDIEIVISTSHFMSRGAIAYRFACAHNAEYVNVQHGLLTPFAPPLPANSTLLAFSEKDAKFWMSGRTDINYRVVGSQLFYDAAQKNAESESHDLLDQPVFLGQMHGTELPRASYAKAGYVFCKKNNARYRPHPSEKDKLSVLTHRLWAKMGIEIDSGEQPLSSLPHPVVSVFSTGVLEAAIRGVPSWVYHPNPPAWVEEFWERYGMNKWGSTPTSAPEIPDREPAQAIAEYIKEKLS